MQHLLDFIHDHMVDDQLYLVVETPAGELELIWQRQVDTEVWQVRPRGGEGPWQRVPRRDLLSHLDARRANMLELERELHGMVATQIVFADIILRDAHKLLGDEAVRSTLHSYREFVALLQVSVRQLLESARPSLVVVAGDAVQTPTRSGHLTVIRSSRGQLD
ncbi:MAG TPA: hypothetical protein VGI70_22165 [Polyangiales bacterium]|jgi:hypothetical protein